MLIELHQRLMIQVIFSEIWYIYYIIRRNKIIPLIKDKLIRILNLIQM